MNKFFNFKFEKFDIDKREISGMASTFGNKDLDRDIIEPMTFDEQFDGAQNIIVKGLWQHQFFNPVGLTTVMKSLEGLPVIMKLAEKVQQADEALQLAAQQIIDAFSIGFMILQDGFDAERDANIITKGRLREVSLVTFPANPMARISDVKDKKDLAELKSRAIEALRNAGEFSKKDAETIAARGLRNLGNPDCERDAEERRILIQHLENLTV